MAGKGRPRDPRRAKRGTGHREQPGQAKRSTRSRARPLEVVADADDEHGPGPLGTAEVVALRPEYDPPADLPASVHHIWRQAIVELDPRGLRPADLESLRQMCTMAARARELGDLVQKHGVLVTGQRGPMINPAIRAEKDAIAAYQRIASEFALTLASRMRLGLMQLAGESLLRTLSDDLDR